MKKCENICQGKISMIVLCLMVSLVLGGLSAKNASAAAVMNLTVSSDTVSLNVAPNKVNGTFGKSSNITIGASTTNTTGYTLSVAATSSTNYDRLINSSGTACDNTGTNTNSNPGNNSSNCLNSIKTATTEAEFSALAGSGYNGLWGYLPSKHNSLANTDFLPAPKASGDILDVTSAANAKANEYTLAIGARVDSTTKMGVYSNTYNVILVNNAIPYSITYKDSVISNMPTDIDSTSESETVYVAGETPTRSGYTFIGWCSVAPTQSTLTSTCSGDTYSPSQAYQIDGSSLTNDLTLYAMWKRNTMQNVSDWQSSVGIGEETTAVDTRDGNVYTVARLCMSAATHTLPALNTCDRTMLWMNQNLDLKLGPAGSQTLSSLDSDINSNLGSGQGYSTSGSTIVWTPASDTMTTPAVITDHSYRGEASNNLTGWTNDNSKPHWAEGGDYYVYTSGNNNADTSYNSMTACINGGHTEEQCRHYHIGNYYNWSAAVATNASASYTSDLYVMPNSICPKGWRLPNGLTGSNGNEIITEFNQLGLANGITAQITTKHDQSAGSGQWVNTGWATANTSFNNFRSTSTNAAGKQAPMYFVRSGYLSGTTLYDYGTDGYLWSSTSQYTTIAYLLFFYSGEFYPANQNVRYRGFPVRCVAR